MPERYLRFSPRAFTNGSSWSRSLSPEEIAILPNRVLSVSTDGCTGVSVNGTEIHLTFAHGGTLSYALSGSKSHISCKSSGGAQAERRPDEEVLKRAPVDEEGEGKGGMYVERVGRGIGRFDMLHFRGQAWAVKLAHLIEGCDTYDWKFSVMENREVQAVGTGWEAWEGKQLTLSVKLQLIHGDIEAVTERFKKMIDGFNVRKQLETLGCSADDQDIVVENLIDRLLVMTTEFKAANGFGIIWDTTKDLYKLADVPDSFCD